MRPTETQLAPAPPVLVELTTDWSSGSASVHCTISWTAPDLDTALAQVHRATEGAPMLRKHPEEG